MSKKAVKRNLVRKRIRDIFRRNKQLFPGQTDIVIVVVSPLILETPYRVLEEEMLEWAKACKENGIKPKRRPTPNDARKEANTNIETALDEPGAES